MLKIFAFDFAIPTPADLWSAGVMAFQLLSGQFPFNDKRSPEAPALSLVWRSILTEEVAFRGSAWAQVSDNAKDFVRQLLHKDPMQR